jgi:hypothetical protein
VITALDGADARRLDTLLGENAAPIRSFAQDAHAVPQQAQLKQAMDRLTAAPEFWISYQTRALATYAQATDLARQVGLVSERGRLLVFDRLVNQGAGSVACAVKSYAVQYLAGAAGQPNSEAARSLARRDLQISAALHALRRKRWAPNRHDCQRPRDCSWG